MLVILLNCVTLGMYRFVFNSRLLMLTQIFRPCEDGADCTTYRCFVLALVDHLIFAYFAAEMVSFFWCLTSIPCRLDH
jgi:uncharacterized membrane protein YvlD (DUF360 family)